MKHVQLDIFGEEESLEDRIAKLKARQEKNMKSFFVRYNLVLKEHEALEIEIDELRRQIQCKQSH